MSNALKGKIRQRLEDELKHIQEEELKEQLVSQLIEKHSVETPASMVDRQTRYLMERYQNRPVGQSGAGSGVPSQLRA